MTAVGGSIEALSLDGRTFAVPADVDGQRNLGGFQNQVQMNGDGSARIVKTRTGWALEGISVTIDDDRGDQEFLQQLADGKEFFPIAVTMASGAIYQGQGIIAGDEALTVSTQNATAEMTLSGPGRLTAQ